MLFANLKRYWFHQEGIWFLRYIVSLNSICMENEKIEVVKKWLKPQSIQDIQVFLEFVNIYYQFIKGLSWIAISLILMLKISGNSEFTTRLRKGVIGVSGNNWAGHDRSKLDKIEIDDGKIGDSKVDDEVGKKDQKTSKSKKLSKSKKTVKSLDFLTPKAKLPFTKLRQAFLKCPILYQLDLERHT